MLVKEVDSEYPKVFGNGRCEVSKIQGSKRSYKPCLVMAGVQNIEPWIDVGICGLQM